MSKHTPGPWEVKLSNFHADVISTKNGGEMGICTLSEEAFGELQANARLIAAAPEMLAVLQEMRAYLEGHDPAVWKAVCRIIAKAEGKP